jgi:hypothetical protein
MDMCDPSKLDSSHSVVVLELQETSPIPECFSAKHWCAMLSHLQLGKESRSHPCLHAGLRIPHLLVLRLAQFRLNGRNLGMEVGRHQWVVWFALGCKRCAALGMPDLPVDDEAQLLFSCPATTVVRRNCTTAVHVVADLVQP